MRKSVEHTVDNLLIAFASYDKKLEARVKSGKLTDRDREKLQKAADRLTSMNLYINGKETIN